MCTCSSGLRFWRGARGKVRKFFFFEKKKQKTFTNCRRQTLRRVQIDAARRGRKSFWLFFQKRTPFLKIRRNVRRKKRLINEHIAFMRQA
jgi:hypothetical protein